MPTTPITLTPLGGLPYVVTKGHLVTLARGPWVLDLELDANSVAQLGMPSGKVTVLFGGVPMVGTIDPTSSGSFGPVGMVRVVAGAGAWSSSAPKQQWHADNGVLSTLVYTAVASAIGEQLVDLAPATLGVDVATSGNDPAMSVFRDANWYVDLTGTTFVGPRPPAIPDPSFVLREWDPVHQKATFACDTLVLPGTPLIDPRFNLQTFTVQNVEQIFDSNGSTGWAWANASPASLIIDDLKAAALYWTRATYLRVYRYRLVQYQGNGPAGGPSRMALQSATPGTGMPDMLPIAPWSGVAGVVSQLAPSQEVLVVFEDANPSLPRVIGYSLVASGTEPVGAVSSLPLSTTIDAKTELDVGPTVPLVKIAGGTDFLVLATPYAGMLSALEAFAAAVTAAGTPPPTDLAHVIAAIAAYTTAATNLTSALAALPPAATVKTKAT